MNATPMITPTKAEETKKEATDTPNPDVKTKEMQVLIFITNPQRKKKQ